MATIISMLSIAHTPPNEIIRLFISYSYVSILYRHFTNNFAILGNVQLFFSLCYKLSQEDTNYNRSYSTNVLGLKPLGDQIKAIQ